MYRINTNNHTSKFWTYHKHWFVNFFCRSWSCIHVKCHGPRAWRCSPTSHTFSLPSTLLWTYSSTHSRYVCQHITHSHCSQLFNEHSHLSIQGMFANISHILIALNSFMNILIYAFKVCSLTSHTFSLPSTLPWTFSSTHLRYVCQHLTHSHCPQLFHEHSHLRIQGKFNNISYTFIAISSSMNILTYAFKIYSPISHHQYLTHPQCCQLLYEHYHVCIQSMFANISDIFIALNSSMNILIYTFKVCLPTSQTFSLSSALPWTFSSTHSK